jgi:hypothetical protein
MKRLTWIALALLTLSLAACGGGGSQNHTWDNGKWDQAIWQ